MENMELIIFDIINSAGTAKGLAYEALEEVINGNYEKADELLAESDKELVVAHKIQTKLIQDEANGIHHDVTVLFVHAQDHLMNAMEARSLISYLISLQKQVNKISC